MAGAAIIAGVLALIAVVIQTAFALLGGDALWFARRRVWLIDFRGDVRRGRERIDRNGVRWAQVYPLTGVGHVILRADGSTGGEAIYIERWSYRRPQRSDQEPIERKNARYVEPA